MIDVAALASVAPQKEPPKDPDEALKFTFARMLVAEVRKAMPQGEAFAALDTLGPVLDDALASQIADRLDFGLARSAPLASPAPREPRVTSGFGTRRDPIHGGTRHHRGIDIGAAEGTTIRAAAPGTVVFSGTRGGYGNLVVVDHGDGTTTRYAHCRDLSVQVGATVSAGTPIATVGSTGRSTGAHLHFEVRKAGVAVDPAGWIDGIVGDGTRAPSDAHHDHDP